MCEPASIAAIVVAAAGAAASHQQQKRTAQAADVRAEDQRQLALRAFRDDVAAKQFQQQQETESASQQIEENQKQAAQARATARVAAGEAGVSGLALDTIMADYFRQEGNNDASIKRNLELTGLGIGSQLEGASRTAESRNNSIVGGTHPSLVGLGTDLAGIGLGAYSKYTQIQRVRKTDVSTQG